ncbi:MAG: hypothetical protein OXD35_08490 [Thiotrichales bacterium]|nr:hypothetical protein [Thiotrichales bacterium]
MSKTGRPAVSTEGADAIPDRSAIFGLDFLTVLRISGGDALAWLQGQLTADLAEVDASTSRIAAWCSPKGRVLAIFRVLADPGGGYRLVCERWFTAALLARLRMFILRSDVRIDDASDTLRVAGVEGAGALPDRFRTWAETAGVDDAATIGEMVVARVPGHHPRFMMTGPLDRVASIVAAQPTDDAPRTISGAWRFADICAGVARVSEAMSDAFLPQMLNLDRFGGVSFEKGCYVGQEIVARAQHLGRVKRRAWVGWTDMAAEGDAVVDGAADEAPKVGDIVAAEPHPDNGSVVFVVLNISSAGSPELRVRGPDGPLIGISSSADPIPPD